MDTILSQESQDQVNLYFVLPKGITETTCSEQLASSHQACLDIGFPCRWMKEEDVLQMHPVKQDVFICDPFEGTAFDHLSLDRFKCVEPVPELPYPLFTAAMRGMVVTSTGFQKAEKNRLKLLVHRMSGVYSKDFHEGVTHLVAGVVASPKYQVAVSQNVPVMRAAWVDRVWELSCRHSTLATDPQFADLTCHPFQGLYICVSQLSRKDKEAIRKIIETKGGHYMAQLECEKTSVLVSPCLEGEKASFARRWKIPCVVPEWLYDSVERGSCLGMEKYNTAARAKMSSTPTKNHTSAYGELADLTVSTILGGNESRAEPVDETAMNDTVVPANRSMPPTTGFHEDLVELDNIDLQGLVKAGLFLDGCKVHLVGFSTRHDEKLRRMLNTSGAMRLSQLLPSVTHVVVAARPVPADAADAAWRPHLVRPGWLVASFRAGRPLPEQPYLVAEPPPPPPPPTDSEQPTLLAPPPPPTTTTNQTTVDMADTTMEATQTLFGGMSFYLCPELDTKSTEDAQFLLEEHGGRQAAEPADARYTLVPLVYPAPEEQPDRLVTLAYLQHCAETDHLLEPEYYHRPIQTTRHHILADCVLGISSYSGRERQFLALLGESMGAEFQEVFARRDNPAKHARASTHLVCQSADGHKYSAARKWGVPTVSRDWLLSCAAAGRRLDTDRFALVSGVDTSSVSAAPSVASSAAPAAGPLPDYMVPPADLTPVRPPQLPAAKSGRRADRRPADMATPQTPYGAVVAGPDPSSSTRKSWKRYLDAMQETPEGKRRRTSTPMSQLVIKFFKGLPKADLSENQGLNASGEEGLAIDSKAVNAELQSEGAAGGCPGKLAGAGTASPHPVEAVADDAQEPSVAGAITEKPVVSAKEWSRKSAASASRAAHDRITSRSGVDSPGSQRAAGWDVSATDADVSARKSTMNDVSRQLAELNSMVTRRSGGSASTSSPQPRRLPTLSDAPAVGAESESAPQVPDVNTQGTAVTWDDPLERQARNDLMSEPVDQRDLENVPPNASDASATATPPVMVFSGMEQTERTRYQSVVERLGGCVLDTATLDPATTHVVTTRPNRSEKHLAAVASGRWLLQPAYLDACDRAGCFLPEDPFEWGNPDCLRTSDHTKDSTEYKLSSAAYRWRRKITEEGIPGVFHTMVAVLLTSSDRCKAFERLLTAGGGHAVALSELDREPVTHVFIEPTRADKRQLTSALWHDLVRRRLPCLPPVYLNECLTAATMPSADDWLLPNYKRLLAET